MSSTALGIDIGGTGIKAGVVDLDTGLLTTEHMHVSTPEGGSPSDILEVVRGLAHDLADLSDAPHVGICFPGVVRNGVTTSAANVADAWIGLDARNLFSSTLNVDVAFVNDADAAGYAEARYGAARHVDGLVLMVTLGTGIGTAMVHDGVLVPNCELGHLEINGIDWENKAAVSAKEREQLSWLAWADRVQTYLAKIESLISPDLIVIGGGVSSTPEKFLPLIDIQTPLVAATLHNRAGVSGAAALAALSRRELLLR